MTSGVYKPPAGDDLRVWIAKGGERLVALPRNVVPQVAPFRVAQFDQRNFPLSVPALERSFALNGRPYQLVLFEPDEALDSLGFCVTSNKTFAVFMDTVHQIIGHTDIGLTTAHISKDIDEGAHANIFQ